MEKGILYMATGEQYLQEAKNSAKSVRTAMDDTPIALITDEDKFDDSLFDHVVEYEFDRVEENGKKRIINSTIPPYLSPFSKTLYLDTDTFVTKDVSELFDLLDEFHLAISPSPGRPSVEELPKPWHRYNCGVIAYRDDPKVKELLSRWNDIYIDRLRSQNKHIDQPAFVIALAGSDLRWFPLPREYNVRVPRRGELAHEAKIIHGRHPAGLDQVAEVLNKSSRHRVFRDASWWSNRTHRVYDRGTIRYHAERTISNYGPLTLVKVVSAYIADSFFGTSYMDRFEGYDIG